VTQPAVAAEAPRFAVQRWGGVSIALTAFAVALGIGFAFVPLLFGANTVQKATTLLILVLLAVMWNALAGYGGLVSVGQQAFIGLGAYATVWLCNHNWNPYRAMIVATVFCGLVAVGLSPLVLRFRGARFARRSEELGAEVGEQRRDGLGPLDVATAGALEAGLDRGRGRQGPPGDVVDHLGRDVLVGPEHGQARPLGRAVHLAAHPVVTPTAQFQLVMGAGHYLAAFPALRTTRSPRYRTPLPL